MITAASMLEAMGDGFSCLKDVVEVIDTRSWFPMLPCPCALRERPQEHRGGFW